MYRLPPWPVFGVMLGLTLILIGDLSNACKAQMDPLLSGLGGATLAGSSVMWILELIPSVGRTHIDLHVRRPAVRFWFVVMCTTVVVGLTAASAVFLHWLFLC